MCKATAHKPPCLWPAPGEWADAVERNDQGKRHVDVTEKLTRKSEVSEAGPVSSGCSHRPPVWQTCPGPFPSSRTLSLGTFPPGSSEGLREKRRALFTVLVLSQTRMPAVEKRRCLLPICAKKARPHLQSHSIVSSRTRTPSTLSIEIQSNSIKTSWQPPRGHRCPRK